MKKSFVALAALAALASGSAFAQKAGDWVIGAGWMHLATRDSSKPLAVTWPQSTVVPGSGASIGNSDTLGLSGEYFFNSDWSVEGVVGVPPTFKLYGTGTLAPAGQLGEAKQWSPAVLAKYHFLDGQSAFRPFVGLGLSYVWYGSVKLTPGLQNYITHLNPQLAQVPPSAVATTADLDSSFAPVFNVGATYQFDKNWGLSFSLSYLPLKTTAKLTTSVAGEQKMKSQASLKINPVVTYLAVTYRF